MLDTHKHIHQLMASRYWCNTINSLLMSLGTQREKGVVYVGSKHPSVYENIIEKEFDENKHIELRVFGRAVTNAIRICEKLVNASTIRIDTEKAVYTRLYSETIDYEGK